MTKQIHASIERNSAAKVVQAGEKLKIGEIRTKGKDLARDIKRELLSKGTKQTRVEAKIEKLRAKLDRVDKSQGSGSAGEAAPAASNRIPGVE